MVDLKKHSRWDIATANKKIKLVFFAGSKYDMYLKQFPTDDLGGYHGAFRNM